MKRNGNARQPLQNIPMNPFKTRNSYPGLEEVFAKGNDGNGNSYLRSPDRSSSIVPSSDILNMSIGARAAIYEQTRQISKYGLDGDGFGGGNGNTHSNGTSPVKSLTSNASRHNASDEWDRLMDRTQDNTSVIESTVMSMSQSNCSFSFMRGMDNHNASTLDENQPLDLTYDQSDYFNSSRAFNLLGTPEKNKAKVDEASRLARLGIGGSLQKRGDVDGSVTTSVVNDSVTGSTSDEMEQSGMIGLFNAAMKFGKELQEEEDGEIHDDGVDFGTTESFISYHEPNLSVVNLTMQKSASEENTDHFFHKEDQDHESASVDGGESGVDGGVYQESFISYREPDLSLISNRDVNHTPSDFGRSDFDVDVSEIITPSEIGTGIGTGKANYASPHRSLFSESLPASLNQSTSDEFIAVEVDEMGIGVEMKRSSDHSLYPPCTTPVRSMNEYTKMTPTDRPTPEFQGRYSPDEKIGWPDPSPNKLGSSNTNTPTKNESLPSLKSNEGGLNTIVGTNTKGIQEDIATSTIDHEVMHRKYNSARNVESGSLQDATKNRKSTEQGSKRQTEFLNDNFNKSDRREGGIQTPSGPTKSKQRDPLMLKTNTSFLSPIDKKYSSDRSLHSNKTVGDAKTTIQTELSPLTPLDFDGRLTSEVTSTAPKRPFTSKYQSGIIAGHSRTQMRSSVNIPQRMSLRDRYSRPDRFEDSYSVPSSASTFISGPNTVVAEQSRSVNRSLLETFSFVA
jgi:hypothetical protein